MIFSLFSEGFRLSGPILFPGASQLRVGARQVSVRGYEDDAVAPNH